MMMMLSFLHRHRSRRFAKTLFLLLLCSSIITAKKKKLGTERSINIVNESGHRIELYWVHPSSGETSLMSTPHILSGTTFPLDSFMDHQFQVRELPHSKTNECQEEQCQVGYFVVNSNFNQVFTIEPGMVIDHADDKTVARDKAMDMISDCKVQALEKKKQEIDMLDDVAACLERSVANALHAHDEEINFQTGIRKDMAQLFDKYVCQDPNIETSDEISTHYWKSNGISKKQHKVKVLHDRPSSKIHIVEQFVSEDECQAIKDSTDQQSVAVIKVPWQDTKHPVATLGQRVYEYTNHVLGLDVTKDGQEDLVLHFGTKDGYQPRCDGSCLGGLHVPGDRVATVMLYCAVPKEGGAINFGNAGIHVKPTMGSAVFVSYFNPQDGQVDSGFTQHSGCPVLSGELEVVTQFVRFGVHADHPWDSFESSVKETEVVLNEEGKV